MSNKAPIFHFITRTVRSVLDAMKMHPKDEPSLRREASRSLTNVEFRDGVYPTSSSIEGRTICMTPDEKEHAILACREIEQAIADMANQMDMVIPKLLASNLPLGSIIGHCKITGNVDADARALRNQFVEDGAMTVHNYRLYNERFLSSENLSKQDIDEVFRRCIKDLKSRYEEAIFRSQLNLQAGLLDLLTKKEWLAAELAKSNLRYSIMMRRLASTYDKEQLAKIEKAVEDEVAVSHEAFRKDNNPLFSTPATGSSPGLLNEDASG